MNLIFNDGYQFGLGAFETLPVSQGRPVWLEAHERRLRYTLDYLGIELSSDWENCLWDYVYSMDDGDKVLKILTSDKNISFTSRVNPYASMTNRPGYVIALSSLRRNETSPLVRHKTFNYGDSILAKRKARVEGIDEPIFCNMQGQLTEGAAIYAARRIRIIARYHPVLSLSMLRCHRKALVSGRYPDFR